MFFRSRTTLLAMLGLGVALGVLGGCANQSGAQGAGLKPVESSAWQAKVSYTGQDAQVLAVQAWWGSWHDSALMQLQVTAQKANPVLEVALARISEARAEARAAGANLWPNANASASHNRSASRNDYLQPNLLSTTSFAGIDAAWELDLWGANAHLQQAELARVQARESQWHDARITLAAEVANTYASLRSAQMQAALARQEAQSLATSTSLLQDMERAGLTSKHDVARFQAAKASDQQRIIELDSQVDLDFKALVALCGIDETSLRSQLTAESAQLPQPAMFAIDALPANVLAQRPDIRIAVSEVLQLAHEVGVADAERYPSVTLLGSIGIGRSSGGKTTVSGKSWSFGPALYLPLFNHGQLNARIDAAQARLTQAHSRYQHLTRNAVREVESAMVRLDASSKQVEQQQQVINSWQAQLDADSARKRLGNLNQVQFEESQRATLVAKQRWLSLRQEQLANWITLYKAVGGQWALPNATQS